MIKPIEIHPRIAGEAAIEAILTADSINIQHPETVLRTAQVCGLAALHAGAERILKGWWEDRKNHAGQFCTAHEREFLYSLGELIGLWIVARRVAREVGGIEGRDGAWWTCQ